MRANKLPGAEGITKLIHRPLTMYSGFLGEVDLWVGTSPGAGMPI